MRKASLLAVTVFLLTPALVWAENATPASKAFSDSDKAAIGDIIKEYLTKDHPEIVMQAVQELQKREQADTEAKNKQAISTSRDKLYNDPSTPIGGNPKGEVTVVEFFDYQCGYCKMTEESVQKLLQENKSVKFYYKEFPILGPVSRTATKAALASVKQNKYGKFHDALMAKKDHLTDEMIMQIAKDVGLNVDKLKKDMDDPSINKIIEDNIKLGSDVGVRGTPMFIVNEKVYPGAMQYDALKQAVADTAAPAAKQP